MNILANKYGHMFYVVEYDVYQPGSPLKLGPDVSGINPSGTLMQRRNLPASNLTLKVSTSGWVDENFNSYPAQVTETLSYNRGFSLLPSSKATASTFGNVILQNADGSKNNSYMNRNNDSRSVRIRAGIKLFDPNRGIFVDPPSTSMMPVFAGCGSTWIIDSTTLTIPLYDYSYWLSQNLQSDLYSGTGLLNGTADLMGQAKPKLRGGNANNLIKNITPILVDPTNNIYQISDRAVDGIVIYEGGYSGSDSWVFNQDVSDIYAAGAPPAGQYNTCKGLGLFRLSSASLSGRPITVDAYGLAPDSTTCDTLPKLVLAILQQDSLIPAAYIDATSISNFPYKYVCGWYWDGSNNDSAADAIENILSGMSIRLIASRSGPLKLYALRAPTTPGATVLGPDTVVSLSSSQLPTGITNPVWRWRVQYQHNFTTISGGSNLSPKASASRANYLKGTGNVSTWSSLSIKAMYLAPIDADILTTSILSQSDAASLAADLGALWSVSRRLLTLVVPNIVGLSLDVGDIASFWWPFLGITSGMAIVTGEQSHNTDPTISIQVVV